MLLNQSHFHRDEELSQTNQEQKQPSQKHACFGKDEGENVLRINTQVKHFKLPVNPGVCTPLLGDSEC